MKRIKQIIASLLSVLIFAALSFSGISVSAETDGPDEPDYTPAFTSKYQETCSYLSYSSEWSSKSGAKFDGGAMKCSTRGASVSFNIDGRAFRIISYKSYSQGKFDVEIDGVAVAQDISLYSTTVNEDFKQIVYTSDVLEAGEHTVRIVHSGKEARSTGYNIYLDAIETDGVIVPSSGNPIDKLSSSKQTTTGTIQ